MARHVRIVAWLWVVYSALITVAALVGMIIVLTLTDDDKGAGELLFLAIGSCIGIVGGLGLVKRASWAGVLVLILAILNLMVVPVGTALGSYTLWALFSAGVKRPTSEA